MTADDLSAPLGVHPARRRRNFPIALAHVVAAGLALFVGIFVIWALVADDPLGGEPFIAVPIDDRADAAKISDGAVAPERTVGQAHASDRSEDPYGGPVVRPAGNAAPASSKTVTIIDGKTGARQQIVIPDSGNEANSTGRQPVEQKFVEMTPQGAIPKIAADGIRPAEAFARPVKPIPGQPDAPRIALIVGDLGISASATDEAIAKLPAAVTLAFMPYSSDVEPVVARARGQGHEILLEVPMEPFGYPENDSGRKALLTSRTPEQNLERLYWFMSRFPGYVGLVAAKGARFAAFEQSLRPILQETARRGLIFVDNGASARSVAGRIAGAANLSFAKADIVLDSVPTPTEIDRALGRLEMAARARGVAVAIASALPLSLEHLAKWANAAQSRGLLLVPITAVAIKAKQT